MADPDYMDEKYRPWCCPEPRCRPLYQVGQTEAGQPGESWSCWGGMAEPVVFVYDGVEHSNDLNSCHYTPLKGVVRFQENFGDWLAFEACYHAALQRLGVGHGLSCGPGLDAPLTEAVDVLAASVIASDKRGEKIEPEDVKHAARRVRVLIDKARREREAQ